MQVFAVLMLVAVALVVLGLAVAYVLVPLFRGLGWLIANLFKGIGWLLAHLFEFVGGVIGDALRLIGAVLTAVVLLPFAPLNVVLGRWSAAVHFADSIKRECKVAGTCLYRMLLRRPLKLVWLHGILEGVEQRLPEAMAAAPAADKPSRRTGQFDGYKIVGSLPGGGSGAKLYIAEPQPEKTRKHAGMPDRVVIKTFALTEGSSLPQIVRESRALESARQLGLVLDHGMDELRFFYVMPYHAGDHLGVITRQLHGTAESTGLERRGLTTALGYTADLLRTLTVYHRGGLWHKDVKPDNVIVHDGQAHLVDLGLVTPLRSAMTLTTHGTEYFRDPEMVRQALRGVKVHQIDGAKFDIYAVGAVLYFLIENTFPAHGGLSRFGKRSPEALRWVIRRAMADYNKRYETADEMLDDVAVLAAAPDPYAVRPVDLPSMTGRPAPAPFAPDDEPVHVAHAGSPTPPPARPRPAEPAIAAGVVGAGVGADAGAGGVRPQLRVTNWWTGGYTVDDPGTAPAGPAEGPEPGPVVVERDQARDYREHSREIRDHAHELREKVRTGAMSARQAAKEQIRSARARARDLRKRARDHRVRARAVGEKQPTPFLGLLVLAFVGVVGLAGYGVYRASQTPSRAWSQSVVGHGVEKVPASELPPVMIVVDGDDAFDMEKAARSVQATIERHHKEGYYALLPATDVLNDTLVTLLNEWEQDPDGPADQALERIFQLENLYGLVRVTIVDDTYREHRMVYSSMPDAIGRRRAIEPDVEIETMTADDVAASRGPLLLVNDHPAKSDPRVSTRVDEIVAQYEARHYEVVIDDDAEASVRQVLPAGPFTPQATVPMRLHVVLGDLGYAGVIRIDTAPGDGEAYERITVTRIDAEAVELDDASAVPEPVGAGI